MRRKDMMEFIGLLLELDGRGELEVELEVDASDTRRSIETLVGAD